MQQKTKECNYTFARSAASGSVEAGQTTATECPRFVDALSRVQVTIVRRVSTLVNV